MGWMLSAGGKVTVESIKEFNTQSPRTTAIVGAAILEDCLGRLIGLRFPVEGETKKQLFKSSGPLGNLDTKVKIAYAMGIVSKAAVADLINIIEIRNQFAHRLEVSDFDHSNVRSKCFELKLIERHLFRGGELVDESGPGLGIKISVDELDTKLKDPRQRYFLSVMLFHAMDMYVPHPDNPKPPLPRALI